MKQEDKVKASIDALLESRQRLRELQDQEQKLIGEIDDHLAEVGRQLKNVYGADNTKKVFYQNHVFWLEHGEKSSGGDPQVEERVLDMIMLS